MVGTFHEPSCGRRMTPIHSIPFSVAQPLERGSNNYYSIIQGRKNMKQRIKKQFWLSPQDARELKRKAKLCGITETAVIRILLHGYEPKEKPDARFYEAMRQLSAIGNNINQLAVKANTLGFIDAPMLKTEALRWHRFQADVEAVFLRPGQSNLKWQ